MNSSQVSIVLPMLIRSNRTLPRRKLTRCGVVPDNLADVNSEFERTGSDDERICLAGSDGAATNGQRNHHEEDTGHDDIISFILLFPSALLTLGPLLIIHFSTPSRNFTTPKLTTLYRSTFSTF